MSPDPQDHAPGRSASAAAGVDEAFVLRALTQANPNALRMAVYQNTRDPELRNMQLEPRRVRGGAMLVHVLSKADRARVVEKALALLRHGRPPAEPLGHDEAVDLLNVSGAALDTTSKLRLAVDELGLPAAGAGADLDPEAVARRKVIIIGAGISGIAAAIRLKALGVPFEVIERQAGVGGTWFLNDYPEARVDISNFIYQYRFEQNFPWSSQFAAQPEIKAYLEHIVEKYEIASNIRLDTRVVGAAWNSERRRWVIELGRADGATETTEADFLISASGLFSTANLPDIPELEAFKGPVFHTTAWDHGFDFNGKRVGLIGNGSSGVQLMPWLARAASHLTVFQRTPNWLAPIEDYRKKVTAEQQWLFANLPGYWTWHCFSLSTVDKQTEELQTEDPAYVSAGGGINERNTRFRQFLEGYIRDQLPDRPDLQAKCIPTYPPLARRLVVDSGWLQSLRRPNVELVTDRIVRGTGEGLQTTDGRLHQLDAIVLGTGFRVSEFLSSVDYRGLDGARLSDVWNKDGARAYLGMFLPRFPNFFVLYGPNGQPQAGSFHDWADRWARYAVEMIATVIRADAGSFEVRNETFEAYNARLDERMAAMVWGRDGSAGYYINEHGRPITKMPWRSEEYFDQIRSVDQSAFAFS